MVAGLIKLWQSLPVRKRLFHHWFGVLGLIAMVVALISVPMTTSIALAMASLTSSEASPCHTRVNPCPDCPQNVCPDMGSCLVKCFQPLSAPIAVASLVGMTMTSRVLPAPSHVPVDSLIPPLLRPPKV
jgi:hypothetical protein